MVTGVGSWRSPNGWPAAHGASLKLRVGAVPGGAEQGAFASSLTGHSIELPRRSKKAPKGA